MSVKFYTDKGNPKSMAVKMYLDLNDINYEAIDITADNKISVLEELGATELPVIVMEDGSFIQGFSPEELRDTLSWG